MCDSTINLDGLRYRCLSDEMGCTAHVSDDASGEFITWAD